jgi:hypothetical protein
MIKLRNLSPAVTFHGAFRNHRTTMWCFGARPTGAAFAVGRAEMTRWLDMTISPTQLP